MNADVFAKWLEAQGHLVVRTESSYWHTQGMRALQAFPYHWVIVPSEGELRQLLRRVRGVGLRYSTPIACQPGKISYHAIWDQGTYDLSVLGKWSRKNVRRGLRSCSVEPISFLRLAEDGWLLQVDTLRRQGRGVKVAKEAWRKKCLAADELPGFEAWGALVDRNLAASVITFLMGDCAYMLYQQCHQDYLAAHVNNALGFVVTQELLRRPSVSSILYGLHSLDAPASVDEFKFRMGYRAKPVRQRVLFHPRLAPLFNKISYGAVQEANRRWPSQPALAKAEGMMRFALEGQRDLADQSWPEPLLDQRNVLLHELTTSGVSAD